MAVKVYIPTAYRKLVDNKATVEAEGSSVANVLADLESKFPGFLQHITDDNGDLRNYINIYINNEASLAFTKATPLKDGDEVAIIPAMAGGAGWSEEQIRRYSRHIILQEVGGKGQRKLLNSKVLLIGAGGLGSPTALYLAAAGVGTLGIVDFDVVDLSNLQRQLLHHNHDVGRPKVVSAAETIADINPDVKVIPLDIRLSSENIMDVIADYDVIIDGADNFPTRYLANDACVIAKKPLVHGSIFRFEGQLTVFKPGSGCYRCIYPAPPPPGMVPSCAEAGVLGVLPGIIGVAQAIEAIKLILGIGETLTGRLLLFDALSMDFRTVKLRRNPECPICGNHPTITELIDYEEFCGLPAVVH